MKQDLTLWQLGGFAWTALGGTLLHFLYGWTGKSPLVAPFSAVNESTWEHMKLLYFPLLIFAVLQSFFFKECPDFWCVKLIGMLTGLLLIPVIFYTYNGAIGKSPDWLNIAIFFIAAAGVFLLETALFRTSRLPCRAGLALFAVLTVGVLFFVFTFYPPELLLFRDPRSIKS